MIIAVRHAHGDGLRRAAAAGPRWIKHDAARGQREGARAQPRARTVCTQSPCGYAHVLVRAKVRDDEPGGHEGDLAAVPAAASACGHRAPSRDRAQASEWRSCSTSRACLPEGLRAGAAHDLNFELVRFAPHPASRPQDLLVFEPFSLSSISPRHIETAADALAVAQRLKSDKSLLSPTVTPVEAAETQYAGKPAGYRPAQRDASVYTRRMRSASSSAVRVRGKTDPFFLDATDSNPGAAPPQPQPSTDVPESYRNYEAEAAYAEEAPIRDSDPAPQEFSTSASVPPMDFDGHDLSSYIDDYSRPATATTAGTARRLVQGCHKHYVIVIFCGVAGFCVCGSLPLHVFPSACA